MKIILSLLNMFGSGKSWQTSIGGVVCLIGGTILLYEMIFGTAEITDMRLALLCACFGGGWSALRAKDSNVHTLPDGENKTMTKP